MASIMFGCTDPTTFHMCNLSPHLCLVSSCDVTAFYRLAFYRFFIPPHIRIRNLIVFTLFAYLSMQFSHMHVLRTCMCFSADGGLCCCTYCTLHRLFALHGQSTGLFMWMQCMKIVVNDLISQVFHTLRNVLRIVKYEV